MLYEIPREVVAEAIVNAVAHRDYISNGSVQVMLFADRLEVWNPGTLPPSLTLAKLRQPHGSVPANPPLAEPMYLTRYIERMGTGTRDMIKKCRDAGLSEPEFMVSDGFTVIIRRKGKEATGEATGEVVKLLRVMNGEMKRVEMQAVLSLRHEEHFREAYLVPAIQMGVVEMTIPGKPRSGNQKYRITPKGTSLLAKLNTEEGAP